MSPTSMAATDEKLRGTLIEASRDAWKNHLIDLSRRNNLLFYRPLVNGTLELPMRPTLSQFVQEGGSIALTDLFPGQELKAANIRTIARKGLENLEEKGLSTLYLALGKCSWAAEDGGRDPFAPVFLLPISLKLKGHDIQSTEVEIAGDPEANPVLIHVLDEEWKVSVTADDLLRAFRPESEEVPGFSTETFAVIGNFAFQKLAMVKDLENRTTELMSSDIVAAIAGDAVARRLMSAAHVDVDPKSLDSIPPTNLFAVMEADSSQQCAILGDSFRSKRRSARAAGNRKEPDDHEPDRHSRGDWKEDPIRC